MGVAPRTTNSHPAPQIPTAPKPSVMTFCSASPPSSPIAATQIAPTPSSYDNNDMIGDDAAAPPLPPIETLLLNHLRFAHAFRQNDAAQILQFLAKDVTLSSIDGAQHDGQSAVLAYLVGARMTKLSANLHVKGCPARSGARQSSFVYEHGLVFKDPLYMEVLDWAADGSATIQRIAHIALPDAKSNKNFQEFLKSSPLRLSFGTRSDDEESCRDDSSNSGESDLSDLALLEPENGSPSSSSPPKRIRCRRLKSNSSVADSSSTAAMTAITAASLRLSSSGSSNQSAVTEAAVLPVTAGTAVAIAKRRLPPAISLVEISCTDLRPIRKRKSVNPFVVLQCSATDTTWKSPVLRREANPVWEQVPFAVPVSCRGAVLELTLWDHSFFRSVKVASAALVVSDLIRNPTAEFSTSVQLERLDNGNNRRGEGEDEPVTVRLRFVRPHGCIGQSVEEEVRADADEAIVQQTTTTATIREALDASVKWLVVAPAGGVHVDVALMLVRAAIVAVLVWMLFHAMQMWTA
ncbi:hypothetical protein BBJ28_00023699 [Nothophytophthora sp. Chile5]|nr:hypothetical protein BBJ28_00023699 [Nothophytophthora sp. Chile5]